MILYKKDSTGKIRSWEVLTDGAVIIQIAGLLDGKKIESRNTSSAKNVGRSNETTAEEQAILEAQSKYTKKLDGGYFKTIQEANTEGVLLPMLAKDYKSESHKLDWKAVYVQPKFDGIRCLIVMKNNKITLLSRSNKEIVTCNHIKTDLQYTEGLILDGELYVHGETFQENMKRIKKYRKGITETVKFNCYDIVNTARFTERHNQIDEIISKSNYNYIIPVTTLKITNEDELKIEHSKFLADGYEGTIVRAGTGEYKINGRSSDLLKYKDFLDEVYTIIDVIPSEKRPEQGQFVLTSPNGDFGCGMKFSHSDREEILINKSKYIGKSAEVRFFEYSETGIPRFPVCVGIRLDK